WMPSFSAGASAAPRPTSCRKTFSYRQRYKKYMRRIREKLLAAPSPLHAAEGTGRKRPKLDGSDEVAVEGDVAVRHARRIEGETGIALAVEKDEAAGGVRAFGEKVNGFAGGEIGCRSIAGGGGRCSDARPRPA